MESVEERNLDMKNDGYIVIKDFYDISQFDMSYHAKVSEILGMDIFEKRNIFILFGQNYAQVSMERWFLKQDKNMHEKYRGRANCAHLLATPHMGSLCSL